MGAFYKKTDCCSFLNCFSPVLPLFRNEASELQIEPMDWFLHNSNAELKWVS